MGRVAASEAEAGRVPGRQAGGSLPCIWAAGQTVPSAEAASLTWHLTQRLQLLAQTSVANSLSSSSAGAAGALARS